MHCRTIGPKHAKIMLVGEAPGAEEEKPGNTLDILLSQAGITRYESLVTNVARERPPANKINFFFEDSKCTIPKPKMKEWLQQLRADIEENKPNVIVALGNTALWALTGEKKISEFRGYILPCSLAEGHKVLATYHPQAINHEWKLFFPTVMDLRKAARHSEYPEIPEDNRILIPDAPVGNFIDYCMEIANNPSIPYIGVDIETVQPGSHIDILGVSHSKDFAMSVRVLNGHTAAMPERDEEKLWSAFQYLVSKKYVVMQNAPYDKGVLWYNNHILVKKLYMDTLIAAHTCWPEMPRDLGFLASLCLDVPPWKGTAKDNRSLYNAGDVCNTVALVPVLEKEMDKLKATRTFDFEMSLIDVSLMMQLQGIKVSRKIQEELKEEANAKAKDALDKLNALTKKEINYNSPKQLQNLLYIDLGLPVQYKKRKSVNDPRVVSADAVALKKISIQVPDNPIFNMILDYKKWSKLSSSFLSVDLSPNDTVHTSYNITGSSTDDEGRKSFGRWSSSKSIILPYGSGNLQNIPRIARKMYVVEEDEVLIQADYVQAEAVVVAYLIGDNRLKQMFQKSYGLVGKERDPYDIHKITASEMFGLPFETIEKKQRDIGKTIRHACLDSETDVLTDMGWCNVSKLNKDIHRVAQWDTDGSIRFMPIQHLFVYTYKGDMIHSYSSYIDQLVTPDHRMVFINRKTDKVLERTAKYFYKVTNGDLRIPVSGISSPPFCLPISEMQARFFTALQADGYLRARERGRREIGFNFLKPRKIERMKWILDSLDIEYTMYPHGDQTAFYINGNKQRELFDLTMAVNKKFGHWVLMLSPEAMEAVVDEAKWWDSRRNIGNNSWQYYSVHRVNCEWMQVMAHLTGRRATVYDDHPTVFTTNITDRNYIDTNHIKKEIIPYDGYVYSLSIESTFYVIKRNGKISVTGNSNYAAGPGVLATRLGIKMHEAKKLMELYHRANPLLRVWYQRIQAELRTNRMLENLLGRKHRFLDRWGDNLFRSAYSFKPQSTVGDLLNTAVEDFYSKFGSLYRLILQLHDAMYSACKERLKEECSKRMFDCMAIPLTINNETFYIDVDFKIGKSWGDMTDWIPEWRQK